MTDKSLIKLLNIIKEQIKGDSPFDARHPRDEKGRFVAIDVHAEAAHENEDPNYDPYADEDIWGPKDDGLKKSGRQLSPVAQEIYNQTHDQIRGHGKLVSTRFPSDAQAHNLFASYKVGPHNPVASALKYMIHRVENLHAYKTPAGAKKADAEFISGRDRALSLARVPDEKRNTQPSIEELHAITTKAPHLIDSLIAHRDALHEKLKGKTKKIDGEPHVALTRGLGEGYRAKDPMLASYADTHENTLGGRVKFFHNHWVPLKNVWYSYDHGPKEATSHRWPSQDEFLVSPHELKTAMSTDVKKLVPRKPKAGAGPAKTEAPMTGKLKASVGNTSLVKLMKSFQAHGLLQKSGQYIKLEPWILERRGGNRLEAPERAKAARQIKGRGKISPQDMKTMIKNRDLDIWDALIQRADLTKDNLVSMAMHPGGFPVTGSVDHHVKKKMAEVSKAVLDKVRAHNQDGDISDKIVTEGSDKAVRRLLAHGGTQVNGQHIFKLLTERPSIEAETARVAMNHPSFDNGHMTELVNHPNPEVIKLGLNKVGRNIEPHILERVLTHANPGVRAAAMGGERSYYGDNRAVLSDAQIVRGLDDPDETVRAAAANRAQSPVTIQHAISKLDQPGAGSLINSLMAADRNTKEVTPDQLRSIVNFGVANDRGILSDYNLRQRDDVPADAVRQIMMLPDGEQVGGGEHTGSIKREWLRHENVDSDAIQAAVDHTTDGHVLQRIAETEKATPDQLKAAWQKIPKDIQSYNHYNDPYKSFADNKNTPSDVLHDMASNLATYGRHSISSIAKHPNLHPSDIEHFANSEDAATRMHAALNPNATTAQISKGISDKDKDVRGIWMKHPKFGAEHLAVAMKDRSPKNRERLASHPAMTPEMLMNILKKDKSVDVRAKALQNPNAGPEHVTQVALHDPDEKLKRAALTHPRADSGLIDHALETAPSAALASIMINRGDLNSQQVEKLWGAVNAAKATSQSSGSIDAMPSVHARREAFRRRNDLDDLNRRYLNHSQATPAMHEKFRATADLQDIASVLGHGPAGTGSLSPEKLREMWDREKPELTSQSDDAIELYSSIPGSGPAGILKEIAESPHQLWRITMAKSPNLPADIQMKLADDNNQSVLSELSKVTKLPQVVDKMISNPNLSEYTADSIAKNPATSPEHLEKLMGHHSNAIRVRVVVHPNATDSIIDRGANDVDHYVKQAAGEAMSHSRPSSYNKTLEGGHEIDIHPATEKLKHLKGKILEAGGAVNKNALPNKGQGLPGQVFTGKGEITGDSIDNFLKTLPHSKFNVSYSKWNGMQRHDRTKDQKVLQLNMTDDHVRQMKEQGLFPTFKKMHELSHRSGHPVRKHSLGWARIDDSQPGHWHIDEIQSDFGQGAIRQLEGLKAEDPGQAQRVEGKFGMPMDQITDGLKKIIKIFSGPFKNINHAIHAAVHQTARQNDITSTSMDKLEDQARQSSMQVGGDKPLPGHMINTYKQIPEDMGYEEKPKKEIMPDSTSNETHVQARKLIKSIEKLRKMKKLYESG